MEPGLSFAHPRRAGWAALAAAAYVVAASLCAAPARAADTTLAVKAAFYDHAIRAFGGEFGARKPGACGYSRAILGPNGTAFEVIKRMVADTLAYSSTAHKQQLVSGPVDCNSLNLDHWFDPSYAQASVCRELAFVSMRDSTGARHWRYQRDNFFPIDDLAPRDQLEEPSPAWDSIPDISLPPGYAGLHNFNWCMEINAEFTYRGGETFRFNGDDDVWVYFDRNLVVDLGGIHGPNQSRVALDSLPLLSGRRGETIGFDMYFCERRPAGSYIDVETDLDLRPAAFLDLDISFPDGTYPSPKNPITGKTRLCAKPDYAAADACANTRPIPADPFRKADWTLDGQVIARDAACVDIDPASLPGNRRILLAAQAEGKSSRLALQVLRANAPVSAALKGNGRLEEVSLRFAPGADSLYAPVGAEFAFAGSTRSLDSAAGEYRAAEKSIRWRLGDSAGPFGVTSLDSAVLRARQTILGFPLEFSVLLADSISPAIVRAAWRPGAGGEMFLDVFSSEPASLPLPAGARGFLFKGRSAASLVGAGATLGSAAGGTLHLAFPAGAVGPRGVDSVSFSALISDGAGNAARPLFARIEPLVYGAGLAVVAAASLEENPARGNPFEPFAAAQPLVVIDSRGRPLNQDALSLSMAQSGGPVLRIRTVEPLDRLDLSVFTNLGAFVEKAAHVFTPAEWDRLRADSPGDTCVVRVLWYPVSRGSKLGTGAYVLKGSVLTRESWRASPDGRWLQMMPRLKPLGPLRFGWLRR